MEKVGMFSPNAMVEKVFQVLHIFKKRNILLVHPLHGGMKMNYKQWLSKGLNGRQW
jgi:hypothetical protein